MKEAADLLRKGARMLSVPCPECGSPLFELKSGKVYCPLCKREVRIVKEGEDEGEVTQNASLWRTLSAKLSQVQRQLDAEENPERIRVLTETLIVLLDAAKRLKEKP
jgi:UPF0148 protein